MKLAFSFLLTGLLVIVTQFATAQSVMMPLNYDVYHLMDRYEIKSGRFYDKIHLHLKPLQRKYIARAADSIYTTIENLSETDEFNLTYLRNDNWEWSIGADSASRKPILKALYRKPSDFYHFRNRDFEIHVNPVLYGFVGKERDSSDLRYLNTRGVELRGIIGRKIGFYSYITDTQALLPGYVTDRVLETNAVPNEGFYKRNPGERDVSYLTARGYIAMDVIKDLVNLQFGYDKNFIGNGYRSMILSDFSSNYLFLRLSTNVWKLNYQNLFGQLTADVLRSDGFFPLKYFAFHHLSINITKNFNLGLFETVVFNRSDTLNFSSGNFDFRYLNPVIFYRSIEQQAGSPDNANLGFDFKWNFLKRISLYGQFVIDEFVIREVRSGNGWRGNKQAGQIGIKYIDVAGIKNLDLQLETNIARPYIYSHNFKYSEYSNYNQPLVHPLGANFYEYIGILRYQPIKRLQLVMKGIYAKYGADENGFNWGSNIFLNNSTFVQEYGNRIGQGVDTRLSFVDFTASWQIRHNMFVDIRQLYRKLDSQLDVRDRTTFFTSLAFRWNIPQKQYEF